jgi:hypothetical protein
LGQRNVGSTRMLAGERPSRLAVSNQVKAWKFDLHPDQLFAPHCQFRISGMSSPYSTT